MSDELFDDELIEKPQHKRDKEKKLIEAEDGIKIKNIKKRKERKRQKQNLKKIRDMYDSIDDEDLMFEVLDEVYGG